MSMTGPTCLEPACHAQRAVAHLRVVGRQNARRTVDAERLVTWVQAVARQSDRQAFACLFTYYAPRLKAYLMRSGCQECQAEELAQESLLTLWRKAGHYNVAQASVGTWLFTIARNLRVDRLRSQANAERPYDEAELHAVADDAPPAEERLHAEQLSARMLVALQRMPAAQARVLRLCYFEGQPHTSIASALDVPLGTVKSRMRAALAYLRRALQDDATP
jgi:RNA polymerase sigma-70 factor (ECF subfamily)